MKPIHITFVTHGSFDTHATLKRATGMAAPLLDAGHKVTILMENSAVNREKILQECPEVSVFWHPSKLSKFEERKLKQNVLKKLQPDLVWICGLGFRNWMFRPKQDSVMLADHSELFSSMDLGFLRKAFSWIIEWLHLLSFDAHVCASRYLEKFYKYRLNLFGKKDKVYYSPYAYHPKMMFTDVIGANKLLRQWRDRRPIVYVGSFWKNYGFWDMLHAFKYLKEKREDFVAVFLGSGPEKEKGMDWIKTNGLEDVIHIEGYVAEADLPAYFTAAYTFLSPLQDTIQDRARCPSKLFMYLPYRKPIVTCSVGEAKELFGSVGNYFEPGNVNSLTDTLERVLNSKNCLDLVVPEKHTYVTRVNDFLNWYKDNADGRC